MTRGWGGKKKMARLTCGTFKFGNSDWPPPSPESSPYLLIGYCMPGDCPPVFMSIAIHLAQTASKTAGMQKSASSLETGFSGSWAFFLLFCNSLADFSRLDSNRAVHESSSGQKRLAAELPVALESLWSLSRIAGCGRSC